MKRRGVRDATIPAARPINAMPVLPHRGEDDVTPSISGRVARAPVWHEVKEIVVVAPVATKADRVGGPPAA